MFKQYSIFQNVDKNDVNVAHAIGAFGHALANLYCDFSRTNLSYLVFSFIYLNAIILFMCMEREQVDRSTQTLTASEISFLFDKV